MAALILPLTIVAQTIGCVEGAGQDYVRAEGALGVVEAHPVFNTSTLLSVGKDITITIDTLPLVGTFDYQFNNVSVNYTMAGLNNDDIIGSIGGNTFSLHLAPGTRLVWPVGTKLNIGLVFK